MKTLSFYLIAFFTVFIVTNAQAADITIDMLNKDADGNKMVYSKVLGVDGDQKLLMSNLMSNLISGKKQLYYKMQ